MTGWKIGSGGWAGRRIMALVGAEHAGHLDFFVHPDGQALEVSDLLVVPAYRGRKLASVMMDALYAACPTAWINHGMRTAGGTLWWNGYSEPAPERNIHNRPPAEWAAYFDSIVVAAQKSSNAYRNRYQGVDGHRENVYRYGESMEDEARQYAALYREPTLHGPDPGRDELYGGMRVMLPPRLHSVVHDNSRDATERAGLILDHIGYGSLPHGSAWNTTEHAAYEDLHQEQVFAAARQEATTHVTFRIQPLHGQEPLWHSMPTWLGFPNSPGIEVKLAELSWRSPQRPGITHRAAFDPLVDAAIAPTASQTNISLGYLARYSEIGDLLPGQKAHREEAPSPYVGRGAEIIAMANRLLEGIAQRAAGQSAAGQPSPAEQQRQGTPP
ncbi:hypothetical protein [Streptomyces sp. NPDC046197]|uniref:hypothetical protein n=1 Tax=Streptomyces sp. NPDC046197 TaxID=3154337 RepID=UPI0033CC1C38